MVYKRARNWTSVLSLPFSHRVTNSRSQFIVISNLAFVIRWPSFLLKMAEYWPREEPHPKIENKGLPLLKRTNQERPPPQALRFSHRRSERETRVTGDKPQGTMGRVQTAGEAPSHPLFPSRLPLRAHFHREGEVWVQGRIRKDITSSSHITEAKCLMGNIESGEWESHLWSSNWMDKLTF